MRGGAFCLYGSVLGPAPLRPGVGRNLQLYNAMNLSRPCLMVCLAALLLSGCSRSPKTAWQRFQVTFFAAHLEFGAPSVSKPLTPERWEKAVRQFADAEDYAARALALAKSHPGTATAEQALWWILEYCPEAPSCKEAVEVLSRDFSDKFANQCRGLINADSPYADHFFQAIVEKSPNWQMRGQAMLARARFRQVVMHDNATAEKLFEQVVAQFAGIKVSKDSLVTLGELAQDDLTNLRSPNLAPEPLRAGQKVPRFEATTTDGRAAQVPDRYRGKVVLLDFWATWCGPCVKEIPNVVDAYAKYHAKGLEVLGVSLDRANAGDSLASFARKHNMPWPQICDGKSWDSPIVRRFGIKGIPHALIVDGDTGLILADGEDARGPKLAAAVEDALTKKQSAPK